MYREVINGFFLVLCIVMSTIIQCFLTKVLNVYISNYICFPYFFKSDDNYFLSFDLENPQEYIWNFMESPWSAMKLPKLP